MDDFDIDTLHYTFDIPYNPPLRGRLSTDWDTMSCGQPDYPDSMNGYGPVCGWTNSSFPPPLHSGHDRFGRLRRTRRRYSEGWQEGGCYTRGGRYPSIYESEGEWGIAQTYEQRYSYWNMPYRHRQRSLRFPWRDYPRRTYGGVFRRAPQPARNGGEAEEAKEEQAEYEVEELETDIDESGPSNITNSRKKASETPSKVRCILPPPGTRPHSLTSARQNASRRASRVQSPEQHRSSNEGSSGRLSFPSSISDSFPDLPSGHAHHHASSADKIRKARKALSKKWEKLDEEENRLRDEEHWLDEWEMRVLTEEVDAYLATPNEGTMEEWEDSG